jgi:hypothetical protein
LLSTSHWPKFQADNRFVEEDRMTAAAALPLAMEVVGVAASAMVTAIRALYGIAYGINDFLDKHIGDMKGSDNPTIARTGRVLEAAKFGFGMGYISSVVIIAAGQMLLGNTLAAIGTAMTAATLTNPIAMTCAAIGAVYYGWNALSDRERNEMLERLSRGLTIGVELVKSVVRFVIEKTNELLSPKNIEEIKKYIGSAAAVFGRTLGDVTHRISDVVADTFDVVKEKAGKAVDRTIEVAAEGYRGVSDGAEQAADLIREKVKATVRRTVPDHTTEILVDKPMELPRPSLAGSAAIALEGSERANSVHVDDAKSTHIRS